MKVISQIIQNINDALELVMDDTLAERLEELGTDINFKPTDEYIEFLKENEQDMEEALKEADLLD